MHSVRMHAHLNILGERIQQTYIYMTAESLLPVKVDCYIRLAVAVATQPDLVRDCAPPIHLNVIITMNLYERSE